jgi:hypothetical protein
MRFKEGCAMTIKPVVLKTSVQVSRRVVLGQIALSSFMLFGGHAWATPLPTIKVWKDPNCGCCSDWVEHLGRNGFTSTVVETADMQTIKAQRNVPAELASCHTAEIAGYTIEGHVPAEAILRLLAEKPTATGLAVPGMPIGSPGMEGGAPEFYEVILFADGNRTVFARFLGEKPV